MTWLGKGSIGKEQLEQSFENTKLRETRWNKAGVSPFSSSLPLPSPPSFFLYFRNTGTPEIGAWLALLLMSPCVVLNHIKGRSHSGIGGRIRCW